MAVKYCDHGAYVAYAAIPAWGNAQDGDGAAKGQATPATASIVFSGIPAAGGNVSVCGVTLAPTWATSATNCANLLATAINAAVGAVTATTDGWNAGVQLRNAVYARGPAAGAPAGTCEIMTRQGSASFNGTVAMAYTATNVNAGASSLTFSGGVSGCWGYIVNPVIVWPSAVAACGYGLLCSVPFYAGSVAGGDVVKVRSGKTIALPNAGANVMTLSAMGSAQSYVTMLIDDSTEWADGLEPVTRLTMVGTVSGSTRMQNLSNAASYINIIAPIYSDESRGLIFENTGYGYVTSELFGPVSVTGLHLSGAIAYLQDGPGVASAAASRVIKGLRVTSISQTLPFIASTTNITGRCIMDSPILEMTAANSPHGGVISTLSVNVEGVLEINSLSCRGFVRGSRLHAPLSPANAVGKKTVLLRDANFGGVSVLSSGVGSAVGSSSYAAKRQLGGAIAATTSLGSNDFFVDAPAGFAGWVSTRSFPTLGAKLKDGITPWSMQVIPAQNALNIGLTHPFETPSLSVVNSLTDGVRAVAVEFGVEQSLSWTTSDVSLAVSYESTDGFTYSEDTHSHQGSTLASSAAAWTNASGSQFTYSDGGTLYFDKKRLVLTTKKPIKSGSLISVVMRFHSVVVDTTKMAFIDPQVQVA